MTQDDTDAVIGRAFRERRELRQKIKCLEFRLNEVAQALTYVLASADHEESIAVLDRAADPLADWAALKAARTRLDELQKVLADPA